MRTSHLAVVTGAIGAIFSGCTFTVSHSISASDLQNDLSSQLEKAGSKPQSVTCQGDLNGAVGQSTNCQIVMTPVNTFEAHVTVTGVDGDKVNFDATPALTQDQLQKQVLSIETQQNHLQVASVNCQSGLNGKVGQTANCTLNGADGQTLNTVVTMVKVNGMLMQFDIKQV
ncbi:MAG: DUF4333 domain-containing protein [Mycobacterium sp.]|nr:DUF4333 domain-containing protein [Mycobacterium sp.]